MKDFIKFCKESAPVLAYGAFMLGIMFLVVIASI